MAELGLTINSGQAKQAVADLDALVPAAARVEQATSRMGQSAETAFRATGAGASEFSRLIVAATTATDTMAASTMAALESVAREFQQLASVGSGVDQLSVQTFIQSARAANEYAIVLDRVAAKEAERMRQLLMPRGAAAIDQRFGIGEFDSAARGKDIQAYGQQLDALRAKYDPLFAAGQQYKASLAEINQAARVGALSEQQRAAAITNTKLAFTGQVNQITGANERYMALNATTRDTAGGFRALSFESRNLGFQLIDVTQQAIAGQSAFMIFAQQGGQLAQIFALSGRKPIDLFKELGGVFTGLLTPARLVGLGIGAIGTVALAAASSFASARRDIERELAGIGRASDVTVDDIERIADTAKGLSFSQGREAATAFAATGKIYEDNIARLTDVTKEFSIVTGQDATAAAKQLAAAFADPVKGADDLNKTIGFLDGRTREYIRTLVDQNRLQEAQRVLVDRLSPALENADRLTSNWSKSWDTLTSKISDAWTALGRVIDRATGARTPEETTSDVQREMDRLQARADRLQELMSGNKILPDSPLFEKTLDDLDVLHNKMADLILQQGAAERAAEEIRLNRLSTDADDAVKSLIPAVRQLEQAAKLTADLDKAQIAGPLMGLSRYARLARRIAAEQDDLGRKAVAAEERRLSIVSDLRRTYGDVTTETAKALANLSAQEQVAGAVTAQERLSAQENATILDLLQQERPLRDAMMLAAAQRAVAEAQLSAQFEQQIFSLRQQTELIYARQRGEEATVAAAQAYDNAIRQGATSQQAASLSAATLENTQARITSQQLSTNSAMQRAIDLQEQLNDSFKTYLNMGGKEFSDFAVGGESQFTGTFTSTLAEIIPSEFRDARAEGVDYTDSGKAFLNSTGAENIIDEVFRRGGSYEDAIDRLIKTAGHRKWGPGLTDVTVDAIDELLDFLPEEDQIDVIERELKLIRATPMTLAREQLIKDLTDSLDDLKESTDDLTIGLNKIYTEGHGALRIGFFQEGEEDFTYDQTGFFDQTKKTTTGETDIVKELTGGGIGIVGGKTLIEGVTGFAGGGLIEPNTLAYVGEHGPNPRLIRTGSMPVEVVPDNDRGAAPGPRTTSFNQTFVFNTRANDLGDRRTRRQAAAGYGNSFRSAV